MNGAVTVVWIPSPITQYDSRVKRLLQAFIESRPITLRAEVAVKPCVCIDSWFSLKRISAVCLAILGFTSVPAPLLAQTTLSTEYYRETQDAEALYFKGNLKGSLERMADARKAVEKAKKETRNGSMAGDHAVAESTIDILEAEVRALQGYTSTASAKLKSAIKVLNTRAQFYAKNPKIPDSGTMLGFINYRLGYCEILRGDLAFEQAFIDSLATGQPINLKRCLDPYQNGLNIIRKTWRVTDASNLEQQFRWMNTCDFRFVRMLVVKGELDRALSYYQDAEELMKLDWVWIVNFIPPGIIEKTLQDADAKLANIKLALNAVGSTTGNASTPDNKKIREEAVKRERRRRGQVSSFSSFGGSDVSKDPIAGKSRGEDGLRLDEFDRLTVRVTITYLESLFVKSELYLSMAETEKNPTPSLEKAEQAISVARDIAEDKLPDTQFIDFARLQLARVYCKRHQESLKRSEDQPDDVVDIDNRLTNVHSNAAKTYLEDAREIVDLCDERIRELNHANPLHAHLLEVRKQLASLSRNSEEIDAVKSAISRFVEKRATDKPSKAE